MLLDKNTKISFKCSTLQIEIQINIRLNILKMARGGVISWLPGGKQPSASFGAEKRWDQNVTFE